MLNIKWFYKISNFLLRKTLHKIYVIKNKYNMKIVQDLETKYFCKTFCILKSLKKQKV